MFVSRTRISSPKTLLTTISVTSIIIKRCHSLFPHQREHGFLPIRPNSPDEGESVAILGGGITGLVSAFEFSRRRPDLKITLIEGSDRLGGWLRSSSVNVGTGNVVFEQGPRNLRPSWPNGHVTLGLISDLDLSDRLLTTSKTSPAAQNRFIYFPDHLVRMPGPGLSIWGNLKNILNEPLFNQLPYSLSKEPRKPKRSPNLQDESVGSFISRRFGSAVADDIVSAIFHGIYAGDIYKLSARSIMPNFWFSETQHGSVIKGLIDAMVTGKQPVWRPSTDRLFLNALKTWHPPEEVVAALKSSVYTLQGGIGEIAAGLEKCLSYRVNGKTPIKIRKRRIVEQIAMKGHGRNAKVELIMSDLSTTKKSKIAREYSHVISTLPAKDLASIVSEKTPLRSLSTVRAVTVMVVNLFYRNPSLLPVKGFGYLLPRSLSIEQNPERALGVVFDSDAAIGQDRVEGTKLTVMIGGHWWDDYDSYPDAEEGESMAKRILARHLNITETPVAVRVGLQKDCIPQYEVGHEERLAQADKELKAFDGRLKVAGSSYTGVGLNDCVKAATACAYELMSGKGGTGLGFFAGDRFMDDTGK